MTETKHHHDHGEENLKSKVVKIVLTVVLLVTAVLVEKNCNLATWQLLFVYLIRLSCFSFRWVNYLRNMPRARVVPASRT